MVPPVSRQRRKTAPNRVQPTVRRNGAAAPQAVATERDWRLAIGWLVALLAVSLGLRLAWLSHPAGGLLLDELFYVSAAHRILRLEHIPKDPYPYAREGLDPLVEHPVGGKLIVAASIRLLGDNAYGWRLPSVVFGTLAILLTFLLAVRLTARPSAGLVAATLVALDPLMLIHSR